MLQSEKDAERYYQAQAKFEQRQRMIDKGWGDRKAYDELLAFENKQRKEKQMKELKEILLSGLLGFVIAAVVVFTYGYRIGVFHS
jgi:hypothetical protein